MAEEIRHPDGRIEHPSVSYERSDASFRWILYLLMGALVLGVVILAGVMLFLVSYRDYQTESKKSSYPLAGRPAHTLPLEPRLEQVDRLAGVETPNVFDREAANLALLNSYGPTHDEDFVHIPVDRAMRLLLQGSTLKVRPKQGADQIRRSGGLVDAGEPNSGRLFERGTR